MDLKKCNEAIRDELGEEENITRKEQKINQSIKLISGSTNTHTLLLLSVSKRKTQVTSKAFIPLCSKENNHQEINFH